MIWGVRLFPGQESKHVINNQLHLTLASLDCRPGKTCSGSAAYLLMKTFSCENIICTLEKGQTNQQQLDLVLLPGEQVTFKVEGDGHVYLTGYSWTGPDSARDHLSVPDIRSVYTGLQPSLQDKLSPSRKQQPLAKKSTQQQSELTLQVTRQIQNTQLHTSDTHNQQMSTDKRWILEEHQRPMEKDTTATSNDMNDDMVSSEELSSVVEQDVQGCDECMQDVVTTPRGNEETLIKYSEGDGPDESGIDSCEGFHNRVEQPDASGIEVAYEGESGDGAQDVSNIEPQGDSYSVHVSDEQVQCKTGDEPNGQLGETVLDGNVHCVLKSEPLEGVSDEDLYSSLNEGSNDGVDGESLPMPEKGSLPGPITDHCVSNLEKSEMSHNDCEEPDGIFTVVVEDMSRAPSTARKMTNMTPGSDQAETVEVEAGADHSGKLVLYQCQICGKVLPSKDSFKIHKEMHTRGDDDAPSAQYCRKGTSNATVTQHNQRHIGESNDMYQPLNDEYSGITEHLQLEDTFTPNRLLHECPYCGKVVSTKASLKVHMRLHPEHTGETEKKPDESLRCQLCGKYFSNISNRRRHEKMHTNGRSFKCHVCGKQLQNKWFLNEHLRIHTQETLIKCQYCDKMFRGEENKKRHEKMHFGATVPFECRFCGKTFESVSGGKRHEAMHTGNRAYKCRFCDKTFNDRRCRESHEGRVHTGERLHKCPVCVKSFYGKGDLDVHMRVHTGEKPYKCRYCDELFTYHTSAKRHEARHVEASTEHLKQNL